jgi:PTS system fructose-specific IIA component/PTS system nitrogen regulatory IIA component
MSNFVVRGAIVPELTARTKEGVIREMVESLWRAGYFQNQGEREEVVREVLRRENLGSTGIGRGIAIPHAKSANVDRLVGTVALSHPGVPFDSIDREDVYVFVLLVSPPDRPGDHLRALENIVRTMRDENFVRALRSADTQDGVWTLLDDPSGGWER